jgi:hypothetical protein
MRRATVVAYNNSKKRQSAVHAHDSVHSSTCCYWQTACKSLCWDCAAFYYSPIDGGSMPAARCATGVKSPTIVNTLSSSSTVECECNKQYADTAPEHSVSGSLCCRCYCVIKACKRCRYTWTLNSANDSHDEQQCCHTDERRM